jgi:hypothetical protein
MKVCEANKKYFAKDDGTPLFFASSYDYSPIVFGKDLWTPLLNAMGNKGNYVRIGCMGQDGKSPDYKFFTYKRVAGYGKTKNGWNDKFDLTQFDPVFFKQLKQFLVLAKSLNIYVHLSLFNEIFIKNKPGCGFNRHYFGNGNHINTNLVGNVDRDNDGDGTGSNEFYDVDALKGTTSDTKRLAVAMLQKKYVDKVIALASKFDNVFFEIGNEVLAKDWSYWWVSYIGGKTTIPVTIPSESYATVTNKLDGVCYHRIKYDYGTSYPIMVGLDSDGDADSYDQASPDVNRDGAWRTFLTGHGILGNYAETIIRKSTSSGVVYSNDSRLSAQFAYFGFLQKFINESGFKFEQASFRSDVSYGLPCLANVGNQYVVYLGNAKSANINLTGYNYKFKVRWYSTKSGAFSTITKIAGGSKKTFEAPNGFDVLFLDKK